MTSSKQKDELGSSNSLLEKPEITAATVQPSCFRIPVSPRN